MPTNPESQLAPSLPGRPSALQDYVRAHQALERVKLSIAQLQSARSELSVIAGDQCHGVARADEALLASRKLYADIEVVIRQLARALP